MHRTGGCQELAECNENFLAMCAAGDAAGDSRAAKSCVATLQSRELLATGGWARKSLFYMKDAEAAQMLDAMHEGARQIGGDRAAALAASDPHSAGGPSAAAVVEAARVRGAADASASFSRASHLVWSGVEAEKLRAVDIARAKRAQTYTVWNGQMCPETVYWCIGRSFDMSTGGNPQVGEHPGGWGRGGKGPGVSMGRRWGVGRIDSGTPKSQTSHV